jgi:hypothetical protein
MARRRIRGDRAFRKLIRRLPEAIREEAIAMLEDGGRTILAVQRADAPRRTGAVRTGLSMRVLRGALQLKVGLVGRPLNRRLWYARIVEKGRKASVEDAARIAPSGLISRYRIRVAARSARPFIYSLRAEAMRATLGGKLNGFWDRVLANAANDATDN